MPLWNASVPQFLVTMENLMAASVEQLELQLNEMRLQLSLLESRSRRPVRRRLAMPTLIFLLGLVVGIGGERGSWAMSWASAQNDDKAPGQNLVCQSLKLIGADGKEHAALGSDKFGGWLKLKTAAGKTAVDLSLDEDGGRTMINGTDGKPRSWLGIDGGGDGFLDLFGKDAIVRSKLYIDADGGRCDLFANDGKLRVIVAVDSDGRGGLINLLDHVKDGWRVIIGVNQNRTGYFEARNRNGNLVGGVP
jgi:hypothetical protein